MKTTIGLKAKPRSVEDKLVDGDYDRLLADFRAQMDAAMVTLREYRDLMRDAADKDRASGPGAARRG